MPTTKAELPPIPAKRYFTLEEVSALAGVKPHVLRAWEETFAPLRDTRQRGVRRHYQHRDVLMVRKLRDLMYDDGFAGRPGQAEGGATLTAQQVRAELEVILSGLNNGIGKS